ncbi:MAG: hypothetical protein KDI79_06805 [Anaerolineae bacterium]|nr:hypothetical protein [Anaerolineae bacterium]
MTVSRLQKAINNPRDAVEYLNRQLFKVVGHRAYKKFIVLGRIRTGSSLLISYLNSHPNIYALGEIFQTLNGRDYQAILDKMFSRQPYKIKAAGFKIFYRQPWDDDQKAIWTDLISDTDIYILHLKRKNILRNLVSQRIAKKTGIWETFDDRRFKGVSKRQVKFTFEELIAGFETIRNLENEFDEKFSDHPKIVLYYEDLVKSPDEEFSSITDFLDLDYFAPKTQYLKQNPENLSQLIRNYDELKSRFSNTEWSGFFED